MKIIYNCFGGSHSSVTAAAIHTGRLPIDRVAKKEELLSTPYFDAQISLDHGRIRFMGYDDVGNEVYIASKHNLGSYYKKIMTVILNLTEYENNDIIFVDTMPYVNIWMMIGGYLSRRLGVLIGRAIIIYGTQLSYHRFIKLVCRIKQQCNAGEEYT